MKECEICLAEENLADDLASFFRKIYAIEGGIPETVRYSIMNNSLSPFCNFFILSSEQVRFHFIVKIDEKLARMEVFFGLELCGATLDPPFYVKGVSDNGKGGFDHKIRKMVS